MILYSYKGYNKISRKSRKLYGAVYIGILLYNSLDFWEIKKPNTVYSFCKVTIEYCYIGQ